MNTTPQLRPKTFRTDWCDRAACKDDQTADWLGDYATPHTEAVCASCPVRQECLEAALAAEAGDTVSGRGTIRGGYEPAERYQLARGRPAPPRIYGQDFVDVFKASELGITEAAYWAGIEPDSLRRILNSPNRRLIEPRWARILNKLARAIPGADHAPGNTQKGNHNA